MTTITNFLEGNFIINPEAKSIERPIWVLCGQREQNVRELVDTFCERCAADRKPLIRLDLGLAILTKFNKNAHSIRSQSDLDYVKLDIDKPVYIVRSSVQEKVKDGFLMETLLRLSKDVCGSQILNKDRQKTGMVDGWGLLVQGLQTFTVLTKKYSHSQLDIESFIASLNTLPVNFRQIVIVSNPKSLPIQVNFGLQRISTCLTRLLKYTPGTWQCSSTVRRFTGYFKQQQYTIVSKEGRVKVSKVKAGKAEGKTEEQKEMISGLGFKAEKDEAGRRQERELREMIFPHLKMRRVCQTGSCATGCECEKEAVPEDLIILDDQQDDDEDLDV